MITSRQATEDDYPFIFNSFTMEFSKSCYADELAKVTVREMIVRYVLDFRWKCTILIDDETPDEIIAYVVYKDPTHIAWIHVKGIYRKKRMASKLLELIGAERGIVKVTFLSSPEFSRIARGKGWVLLHRPWQT